MASKHLKAPFRPDYEGGYVFNADNFMFAQVRGWGQLQYEKGGAETQDEHLRFICDALNQKAGYGYIDCEDCGQQWTTDSSLIVKGDHHGHTKRVCADRDGCHLRSPG